MYVLGVHIGHDSGASLIKDGQVVASVIEERFNKIKHYGEVPWTSVKYCLKAGGIESDQIDILAVPTKGKMPELEFLFGLKGHRITKQPTRQAKQFFQSILGRSLPVLPVYRQPFKLDPNTQIMQVSHHLAHAASAYYTSGFTGKTLIVTCDGVGDGVSLAIYRGENGTLTKLASFGAEGSLGWFYGAVTEALGWWVGDGEGKTMGLAPYGDASKARGKLDVFVPRYQNGQLVKPHKFGVPGLWFESGVAHWHFQDADPMVEIVQKYGRENVAAEAQRLLEEEMLSIQKSWLARENTCYLATAGGVFLNVKMNQRIWETGLLDGHHIYHNAGDGGLTVGAAFYAYHQATKSRNIHAIVDAYDGPEFSDKEIEEELKVRHISYTRCDDIADVCSEHLAKGLIVGWMQGRMESGPRALGARSILMDPRRPENKDIINNTVKYREPFRPFCPSMTAEAGPTYLMKYRPERYMITSFDVPPDRRGDMPAVVHVDGTARPQTVEMEVNPLYHRLLTRFGDRTGVPVVLNTSFNIKGDPIICTPADAIQCFYNTGMHALCMGPFFIKK